MNDPNRACTSKGNSNLYANIAKSAVAADIPSSSVLPTTLPLAAGAA